MWRRWGGALFDTLNKLLAPPYNVKSLQTFVCNGVAAKFKDPPALYEVMDRLQTEISTDALRLLGGNTPSPRAFSVRALWMPWWTARGIYAHLIWSLCRR